MGKLHIIHCEDCGAPRMTRYKNTRYCEICRLLRNLKFVGDATAKCLVDKRVFAPIKRGQQLSLTCDYLSTPGGEQGQCGICERDDQRLYGKHVRVCVECLDDPKKREAIRAQLIMKQKAIIEGRITIETPELPVTGTEAQEQEARFAEGEAERQERGNAGKGAQ